MKTRRFLPFFCSLLLMMSSQAAHAQQTRTVLKQPPNGATPNALLEPLATGSNAFKISAAGTLVWENGATFTGAGFFRTAAGLEIGVNVQAYDANTSLLGSSIDLTSEVNGTLPAGSGGTGQTTLQASINALAAASGALSQGDVFYFNGTNFVRLAAGTDGQYLKTQGAGANPTWGTVASGLTIGSTAVSGASAGDLLISDGTLLQKITLGTGVSTALANAVNASGGLLTYGIIGTSGAAVPLLNAANTFSATQTFSEVDTQYIIAPTGQKLVLRSGLTSSYAEIEFQRSDGTPEGYISFGTANFSNYAGANSFILAAGYLGLGHIAGMDLSADKVIGWTGVAGDNGIYTSLDTVLSQAAAGVIKIAHGTATSPAGIRIANTWTSSTSYEAGVMEWQTTANTLRIGSDVGSAGGTARDVQMVRGGVVKQTFGANTTDYAQPVKLPSYIVSGLPSASTCGAGSMAFVTDATVTTAYTTVAGGGSNKVLVISDGTNWIIH